MSANPSPPSNLPSRPGPPTAPPPPPPKHTQKKKKVGGGERAGRERGETQKRNSFIVWRDQEILAWAIAYMQIRIPGDFQVRPPGQGGLFPWDRRQPMLCLSCVTCMSSRPPDPFPSHCPGPWVSSRRPSFSRQVQTSPQYVQNASWICQPQHWGWRWRWGWGERRGVGSDESDGLGRRVEETGGGRQRFISRDTKCNVYENRFVRSCLCSVINSVTTLTNQPL